MLSIRRARLGDVNGISTVVAEVWGQAIDTGVCLAHIRNDACAIWVAVENGVIAGFVSAFLTCGLADERRWEVDLLAVRPAWRGRQLGQKLVAATWVDAQQHQVDEARAIIRIDNIASQRSFERAGYTTDYRIHRLLLWTSQAGEEFLIPPGVTFVPVDTLTYRGLWLEGLTQAGLSSEEQRQVVATARALVAAQGRENTGALIAVDEAFHLPGDLETTVAMHGEYHWWRKFGRE
jgi:ribosomal protein S18 acetylase RimI-like enzyme